MSWQNESKAEQISRFVDVHLNSWSMTAALDAVLSGKAPADGPTIIGNEDFDRLILNATIYGAADSFSQSVGASTSETAEGIRKHLDPYSDSEDAYRQIIICGTMPEFADAVTWAGQCVYEIRAKQADPTQQYLQLFDKIKARYGSK
jgi:hypothetical protein